MNKINPYITRCRGLPDNFIDEPEKFKGKWKSAFGNNNDVFLDLGCGNGDFTVEQAGRNKEYNFIGIDLCCKYLFKGVNKAASRKMPNLKFLFYNIKKVDEIFDKEEIEGIYLLFSDPYWKNKHMKHRVLDDDFLRITAEVLKPERYLVLKTDDADYFKVMLKVFTQNRYFKLINSSTDYDSTGHRFSDIISHYEIKFGHKKVKWLVAQKSST